MAKPSTFEVTSDATANLLRIRLHGDIDAASMRACVDQVAGQLPALFTDFKVLTDLSAVKSMEPACVSEVERLMDLCRDKGVDTVVRVIPKRSKDVGFTILSLFHYPKNVHIVTCPTPAEAERALS